MAYKRNITADDKVFFDTDRTLRYTLYEGDPTDAEIAAGTAIPLDVTGWSLGWTLRKKPKSEDILIEKTTAGGGISITGTFNIDPTLNTQRVDVLIEDTDTYGPEDAPVVIVDDGTYAYALKRLDAGSEGILAWGSFRLIRVAAWE